MKFMVATPLSSIAFRNIAYDIANAGRPKHDVVVISSESFMMPMVDRLLYLCMFHMWSYARVYAFRQFSDDIILYFVSEGEMFVPKKLLREVEDMVNKVITVSYFSKKFMEKSGARVDYIVPHGIDVDFFRRSFDEPFANMIKSIANGKRIVVTISSNHRRKNIDLYIETIKILLRERDDVVAVLHIGGRGDYDIYAIARSMRDLVEQRRLIIPAVIVGRNIFPRTVIATMYKIADIYFYPSGNEGFGLTLLESLASGTPIVHVNAPPMIEITTIDTSFRIPVSRVDRYTGFDRTSILFRFDPEKAVDKIIYALDSDLSETRRKCIERAIEFDYNRLYSVFFEKDIDEAMKKFRNPLIKYE